MRGNKKSKFKLPEVSENTVDIVILLAIFTFIISYFPPDLILLNTTTSGGDTGSDNYLAKFMSEELLPNGKIFGWSMGRWAGYPIFQFIFPLPYIMMALLSYVGIPLVVAFKIITVLPVFLIPAAAYLAMRWIGFKFPTPVVASALSVIFLFQEKNNVFGGNIPSMLAGEFSYALSMGFMILFLGFSYKKIQKGEFSLWMPALYFLTFFSHVVTAVAAGLGSIYFLAKKNKEGILKNFKIIFLTYFIAIFLIAFWLLPLVTNMEYTTKYGRDWGITLDSWFPKEAIVFVLLGVYALARGIESRDKKIMFLVFCFAATVFAFFNGELLFAVNIRYLPPAYFFLLMISAAAIGDIISRLAKVRLNLFFTALLVAVIILYAAKASIGYTPGWVKWNYEGFEKKADWPTFEKINKMLNGTDGRGYVDLADVNNRIGTPRAFESLPYFAGRNTLEGVYAQSTITSPFISYTQCEISHHCAGIPTIGGKEHTTVYNFTDGVKHLKILNVKYLVATFNGLQADLGNSSEWEKIGDFNEWKVFRLNSISGSYVSVPKFKPNLMRVEKDQRKIQSLEWWMNTTNIEVPVVMQKEILPEDVSKFAGEISSLNEIKKTPLENNCIISGEKISSEEISFKTNCVGKPHIVSVSYFPNWHSEGGEEIYYVSPSLMLIFPKGENVKLAYSPNLLNLVGTAFTLLGILSLIFVWRNRYDFEKSFGLVQ
ncbi:MAG TPA: 6-pyruvoyl-tetrahydropterin synthase-related protein [archaeon]|nr:6-pyruvoyl-tetrahydropterin synthase-related protein [archaeon]